MKKATNYIKRHNLTNRIYDILCFLKMIKNKNNEYLIKKDIRKNLYNVAYVENLAYLLEKKYKKIKNNIELKFSIKELIHELNYLKIYINDLGGKNEN